MLEAVDPFAFVKGFIFNLPPGTNYPLKSPAHLFASLPGTLCGRPVQTLIDETVRFWYGRIDRQRHAIVGVGAFQRPATHTAKSASGLRWCSYTQRWFSGGQASYDKSTRD